MVQIDGWLDTGDKVASVVGALAGSIAVLVTLVTVRRRRREAARPASEALMNLLRAQERDALRHRYRFFGDHIPSLRDVYVRQHVSEAATAQRTIGVEQLLAGDEHMLLLGGAGAGKSALVAAVVAESARLGLAVRRQKVYTVAVSASDLVDRGLPQALAYACMYDLKVDMTPSLFERPPVPGGRWRVMIDGVDEIIDSGQRSRLLWSIGRWLQESPRTGQLVITSRPLPESEMRELRRAKAFDLQPFDRGNLDDFAVRWFGSRYPDDPGLAAELAERFVLRVAGARLGPVARVPLLATIAALVFESDRESPLPSSRAALYQRFVAHLLSGRQRLRHLRDTIESALSTWDHGGAPSEDFPTVLDAILDEVGAAQVRDRDVDLIGVGIDRIRRWVGRELPNDRQMLRDILLATGMFTPRGGRLLFTHHSFAEFFAARENAPRFDVGAWRELMANPAGRSLAAFMAALRPDADELVVGLLDNGFAAAVAGDLLADGVSVLGPTRKRIIDELMAAVVGNTDSSGDALRVLRELSVDSDVYQALTGLHEDAHPWARAAVADLIADVDPGTGARLLREAAKFPDAAIREWAVNALNRRGFAVGPVEWEPPRGPQLPLGVLGRQALANQLERVGISDDERVDAALRLADDGEFGPLRSLLDTPGITDSARLRAAEELAAHGDDTALVALAGGTPADGFYVPKRPNDHWLRYLALSSLRRRRHTMAVPLLKSFVSNTNGPSTFGAAAMLAEFGDLEALAELATAASVHPTVATAAARMLADVADAATLRHAQIQAAHTEAKAWLTAALLSRGNTEYINELRRLLRHVKSAVTLHAILAANGDAQARRRLLRSLTGTVVLSAFGDEAAIDSLNRTARRGFRANSRIRAATALGRAHGQWQQLYELARASRPRRRLQAATRIANETVDVGPLLDLIFDDGTPLRYRENATEILWRCVRRADDASSAAGKLEESPPPGTAHELVQSGPTTWMREPVILRHQLPGEHAEALCHLAENPATPTRLRLALAKFGLPAERAAPLLAGIAVDPSASSWQRLLAAQTLQTYDHAKGDELLRTLLADTRLWRVMRWRFLVEEGDDNDWEEFAEQFERIERIEDGSWRLVAPRLVWLFLQPLKPNPPAAARSEP